MYSTSYFVKEALVNALKPKPIDVLPSNIAYQRRKNTSLFKYLILAGIMVSFGCFFLFGSLWLEYIGLTLNCFTIPLIFVVWFLNNDRYEPEPTMLIAYVFGWGAIAALLSYFANPLLYPYLGVAGGALVEEPLKLIGIYLLARGRLFASEINSHLDGILYGAAVGAGFASLENILYLFYGGFDNIFLFMLIRMTTAFSHMAWTAIAGRSIGLAQSLRGRLKITDLIPGLLIAVPLHFLWNSFDLIRVWVILPVTLVILFREMNMAVADEGRWGFKLLAPYEKRIRRRRKIGQAHHNK